jgi:uncharacterized phage protein (TIGR01671 family)
MREILFRAKIKGSGAWVEGNLVNCKWWFDGEPITVIIPNDAYLDPREGRGPIRYVEVIPETVGQYTGLKDKNGKKVFDGDIVHNGYGDPGVVRWSYAAFEVHFVNGDDWDICQYIKGEYTEVIGNVYDNPVLVGQD